MASAKIDADVLAESKIAAAILGLTLSEFLTLAAKEKADKITAEYAELKTSGTPTKPGKPKGGKP